jgi:alpha-D-ribose 1-methylphosphonate 5-triphosphate synthase subunit PhnG
MNPAALRTHIDANTELRAIFDAAMQSPGAAETEKLIERFAAVMERKLSATSAQRFEAMAESILMIKGE